MTKIDWSKAPESAEFSFDDDWFKTVNGNLFIYKQKKGHQFIEGEFHWAYYSGDKVGLRKKVIIKPSKPLYTTKMQEAGELPSVGMECIVINCQNKPEKCTLLYSSNTYYIVAHGYGEQHYHARGVSFKPVDTRTDKEKAIEDFNDGYDGLTIKASELALSLIISGKIRGVTFTGSK